MIYHLFSTPIYKINILNDVKNIKELQLIVDNQLKYTSEKISSLEKNGGKSTYETNNQLHLIDTFKDLSNIVLFHCKMYWKILDIDERLSPRIDQCWTNLHQSGSFTMQHSHSLMPMVATFYLQAENNSGDLILINPAEYSLTNIPFCKNIEQKIETNVKIQTGDLILFPGYIRHKTGENFSLAERKVISFNIGYEGKYLSTNSCYPNPKITTNEHSETEMLHNKILNLEFIIENLKQSIKNEK